jgi:hypothetical protein
MENMEEKEIFVWKLIIILKWNVWVEHESVVHPFYKSISWPKSWLNQYVIESVYLEMECKLYSSCFIFAVGEAEFMRNCFYE